MAHKPPHIDPTGLTRLARSMEQAGQSAPPQIEPTTCWSKTVSTGSTLLDKAISGLRCRYGGLPGGMVVEIAGPPGTAKTTIGAELAGSAQRQGGEIRIEDPEARLDHHYCSLMGVRFSEEHYNQPDTVTQVIGSIIGPLQTVKVGTTTKTMRDRDAAWKPDPANINVLLVDSLAALSTQMEMEQGDKMGQRRAKELSEGLRLISRHVHAHNILMVCTNQVRANVDGGPYAPKTVTPGGFAIPFYSSVRIHLTTTEVLKKGKGSPPYGKLVQALIVKNSKDIELRTAPIRLIFGYGIDDLGMNLQWLKDQGYFKTVYEKETGYVVGEKWFAGLDAAIKCAEDMNLERDIKEAVIDMWDDLEARSRPQRKDKVR